MELAELWELIIAIPAEVLVPSLAVFAIVGALKAINALPTGSYARVALFILSFLTGGADGVNSLDEALVVGMIALFAAAYHRVWEWAKDFLAARGESGAALATFMSNPIS